MLTATQVKALRRNAADEPNRLKAAMRIAGVTQLQLEAGTGIPQSYISKIARGEYGERGLPLETTRTFATFFGCAIEDLFPARQEVAS